MHAEDVDDLVRDALTSLADDPHVRKWRAKEHNWVNYFVFRHLVSLCRPDGPLNDLAQIGIEIPIPQPLGEGRAYKTKTARRDVVLWPSAGVTCWDDEWKPTSHPLAILEWKVHRPGHRNRDDQMQWLKDYCHFHPSVMGYGVEVRGHRSPETVWCCRFLGDTADMDWFEREWLVVGRGPASIQSE